MDERERRPEDRTETENRKPVFPKAWGWERYEAAVREQAAQCARLDIGRHYEVLTRNEQAHTAQLISNWDRHQVQAGLLPSAEEREKKGQPYADIFEALKQDTMDAIGRRDIGNIGTAHWELEKQENRAEQEVLAAHAILGAKIDHYEHEGIEPEPAEMNAFNCLDEALKHLEIMRGWDKEAARQVAAARDILRDHYRETIGADRADLMHCENAVNALEDRDRNAEHRAPAKESIIDRVKARLEARKARAERNPGKDKDDGRDRD